MLAGADANQELESLEAPLRMIPDVSRCSMH